MSEPNFERINQAILRAGGNWKSSKTSHSKYWGIAPTSSMFGLSLPPELAVASLLSARAAESNMFKVMAPPPKQIDWRSHKGQSYVTPIRDQQSCGACVAFATCASMESRALLATAQPGKDFDLSEAHLFYCGSPNSCGTGWNFVPALNHARKAGVGMEADFPYTPADQACRSVKPAVKVKSHAAFSTSVARKQALQRGPVIAGLQVFEDFYTYAEGIYGHVSGDFLGLHAVCVIGYDDAASCWIVKNSWGTGWGEGGFFRISYGECGIDTKFLFYEPDIAILPQSGLLAGVA